MMANERKLVNISLAIFALSGCILLAQFIMANLPKPKFDPLAITPEREAQIVQRCREMRAKLRPWAEKNANLLHEMLKANPEDKAKLEAVWNEIPALTISRNHNDQDVVIEKIDVPPKEFNKPVNFYFIGGSDRAWAARDDSAIRSDPNYQRDMQMARSILMRRKAFYWEKYRDIPWIESMMPGRQAYMVWASGRVTRHIFPENLGNLLMKTKTRFGCDEELAEFKEIEGPYEFTR